MTLTVTELRETAPKKNHLQRLSLQNEGERNPFKEGGGGVNTKAVFWLGIMVLT